MDRTSPITSRRPSWLTTSSSSGFCGLYGLDLLYVDIRACVARLMICARHLRGHNQSIPVTGDTLVRPLNAPNTSTPPIIGPTSLAAYMRGKVIHHSVVICRIVACHVSNLSRVVNSISRADVRMAVRLRTLSSILRRATTL